ncbi:MAG: glycosyltransferase family 2 protein [Planctomycetes bacterium]|nr:glycosyltransferase family 2 protein [Planctomycetota bacterium]
MTLYQPPNSCDDQPAAANDAAAGSELELTVLMPCLDEAETIAICIEKAQRAMRDHEIVGEVLIADNGSSDGSQQIAADLGARVVHVKRKGYGNALMGGIRAARGRFIIMADADDSYNFLDIPLFLEKLRNGHDLVMGNRFAGGIKPGAMPFLHKYLGNPVLSAIGRLFFRCPCSDFHCGLRGFSKSAATQLDLRATGMEFASEMVVKATLYRMRIAEVPTTLSPDGRSRPAHLRTWRDGWRHLRFMLLYSPRWLFLYPGAGLMTVGLIVGLWLLGGPRTVSGITLDVHTLLYSAAAVLVGFQAVTFAVFSKIYGITVGLMPEDPRMTKLFKIVTLETGLIVGAFLVLTGLALSGYAVATWASRAFGELSYTQTMRLVIPALAALVLGCQVILSSFFLSLLGMGRR